MKTRKLLAAVLGSAMALGVASAAFAFAANTPLNQTGTALTPADTTVNCAGAPALDPGETAWHFVYTADGTGTLNGHFAFSDGVQEVASFDQGSHQAWWIVTDSSATLNGSLTYTDGTGGNFNLSGACVASTATASPSPSPTASPTASPTLPPTSTVPGTPTSPSGTSMNLVLGLILLIAGGVTAYAMRPRRSTR
jgi:hypothetical protein